MTLIYVQDLHTPFSYHHYCYNTQSEDFELQWLVNKEINETSAILLVVMDSSLLPLDVGGKFELLLALSLLLHSDIRIRNRH